MDYYLEDPERLNGQPKRTIADYVEENGFSVPRRFDSIREARAFKGKVIARSEHTQDYDGVSGMIESEMLDKFDDVSEEHLKEALFTKSKITRGPRGDGKPRASEMLKKYHEYTGKDPSEFYEELSYSYWEYIEGFRRKVVADSSIPDRYHITTYRYNPFQHSYTLFEGGKITSNYVMPLPPGLVRTLPGLIRMYEGIRHLSRFDPNHCPIMEFLTRNHHTFFLQNKRARNFEPCDFSLGEEDGVKVWFVRGATGPEGLTARVSLWYSKSGEKRLPDEDGSFDWHYDKVLTELMARKRLLQIETASPHPNKLYWELLKLIVDHNPMSKMFLPKVSVIIGKSALINEAEAVNIKNAAREIGEQPQILVHVVSDGRKAYLKRVD